jgi:hypothetical protein
MLNYSCKLVLETLNEICAKFEKTKNLKVKKVKFLSDKSKYQVILTNGSKHLINQALINKYIETFGEKNTLKIAGQLSHNPNLEESVNKQKKPEINEYWEGNMKDVNEYLRRRDQEKE